MSKPRLSEPLSTTGRFDAKDDTLTKARLSARGADFSYVLDLSSDRPVLLRAINGYSRKSEQGQASYYFSQPFFTVEGTLTLHGRETKVTGRAWMDREWSSQWLAPDQTGRDWFAMHLSSGEKVMLYRIRAARSLYSFGNWISPTAQRSLSPGTTFRWSH